MSEVLILKHHDEIIARYPMEKDSQLLIGRDKPIVQIEIPLAQVSRQHLIVRRKADGQMEIEDLQSTNGTFLNGERVTQSTLQSGDVLSFSPRSSPYYLVLGEEQMYQFKPVPSVPHQLQDLLAEKKVLIIGRQNCDIQLPNLTVSRQHAAIYLEAEGRYRVEDLDSKNGTFVNGKRISKVQVIGEKDRLQIAKYEFVFSEESPDLLPEGEEMIRVKRLKQSLPNGKVLLNTMSFRVLKGEFIAIMGPSGSGKSTLLKALNGYQPAKNGQILFQGKDFYQNYHLLKQIIGYVPQDDTVHNDLSIYEALYFAGKLRLPSDVETAELASKIEEILQTLNLYEVRHNLIRNISGGQRKRVSIAVELLSDPAILFLDEPTSPLDPETIEEFLKILRRLAAKGTTIMMVTHKPDDLQSCDKVIFLAPGGKLVYYAESSNYLSYFEAPNATAVYAKISKAENAQAWVEKYQERQQIEETSGLPSNQSHLHVSQSSNPFRQWFWLSARYLRIKTSDQQNTLLLLLQAPIIALLLILIFEKLMLGTLFMMVIAALWLGTANAAREIVAEKAIYERERMFNLQIMPYLLSKISILSLIAFLQVSLLCTLIALFVGTHHLLPLMGLLFVVSLMGSLSGLLLSALAGNPNKVMSIVPLILLPQIMLAGVIQRLPEKAEWLSFVTTARWGMESAANIEQKAYFYYPDSLPNPKHYEALEGISPLDTARIQQVEDSLKQANVSEKLFDYVEEDILQNANMLEFPTYFSLRYCLLFLGLQGVILLSACFLALRLREDF